MNAPLALACITLYCHTNIVSHLLGHLFFPSTAHLHGHLTLCVHLVCCFVQQQWRVLRVSWHSASAVIQASLPGLTPRTTTSVCIQRWGIKRYLHNSEHQQACVSKGEASKGISTILTPPTTTNICIQRWDIKRYLHNPNTNNNNKHMYPKVRHQKVFPQS
jgi:hypothetical protein